MELSKDVIGIIGCISLIGLVMAGVRVYIASSLVGFVGLVWMMGWSAGAGIAGTIPHSKTVGYTLSVLPLFILIGYLAFHAGITQSLFEAAKRWLGWMPGGLAIATIFAVAGFSAVSGASTAAAAVFARVAIPEMLKAGYAKRLAAGVVAAGGTLDALIPPSAIMVIYAIIVEASIGKLMIAGFLPGLISALCYVVIILIWSYLDPTLAKPLRRYTWTERFASLPGTFPVVSVIGIIFSAMYFGWATPTEAGALGAFVVYVLALFKGMKWKPFENALVETAKLTVMIFAIVWGVLIFVRFLGYASVPETFSEWVVSLPVARIWIIVGILFVYLVLGCFMDAVGMMLLTLPIFYPAVIKLGYDPIWFGILVIKMAGVALMHPPLGLNCFVVTAVRPDVPLTTVFRGVIPFLFADFLAIAIFLVWPETITWLPNAVMD
jgi:tripartite ATP-independent transporter DctM subunit